MTHASPTESLDPDVAAVVFPGRGEMATLCRAFDWASTPLGPVSDWSQSLRTAAGLVLASSNPMFLWWGPELIQIYNDAYRPSFGEHGRHPVALGMRGRECWTDIWETIAPQIEQVMTTGEATWHEDQHLPIERNGRLEDVWWTYSYSPIYDDDGTIGGTLVVCQETTGRVLSEREREAFLAEARRAEAALRASEARYRSLFESLDEGFCVIEMLFDAGGRPVDYRFVEANAAFIKQSGLEEAVGKRMRELVPGHDAHWFEIYGRVAVTGEPTRFEAPAEAMGRWFDAYAFRVGEPEERMVAVLFKDITAEREAEAERERLLRELRVERARLEEAFRKAPSFLAVMRGPEHVFELVNEAFYGVVGHREILGRPVREALPEVRDQGFADLLDGVLGMGVPFVGREVPISLIRTPGVAPEQRYVDFVYQPLTEADGTRSGVIAHGSDVTEQVLARKEVERLLDESNRARAGAEAARAEAEAARAEAEAARAEEAAANRAKTEFLAVMSHELRTPLNAIAGYAQLLEMGIHGPVNAQQRTDLQRIQASQRHLLSLINDVLNYARLETGNVDYQVESVPARETVTTAQSLLAPQAQSKGLTLLVGDCPSSLEIRADPEKVRQILINILSNAVKFTAEGGLVEISCLDEGPRVAIRVRDTGIGMSEDDLDRVFDPFVQVRTDRAGRHEGTGLGLAISRDLARGMGGDLTAESAPGKGSTFTLTLPCAT